MRNELFWTILAVGSVIAIVSQVVGIIFRPTL